VLTFAASAAWLAAVAAALALFCSPVIFAAARRTERIGLVVLLTVLGLAGGVTWVVAWGVALTLPRRGPAVTPFPPRAW
jgi:hypothetical protein